MSNSPSDRAIKLMDAIGEDKIHLRNRFNELGGPGWGITTGRTIELGEARKCTSSYIAWIPCDPFKITELAIGFIPDATRAEISKDTNKHFVVRVLGADDTELIKLEGDEVYELVILILDEAIKNLR